MPPNNCHLSFVSLTSNCIQVDTYVRVIHVRIPIEKVARDEKEKRKSTLNIGINSLIARVCTLNLHTDATIANALTWVNLAAYRGYYF